MCGPARRLLVLGILVSIALVADATTAEANGCSLGPYVQTYAPPIGCPVTVLRNKDHAWLSDPPHVEVIRAGEWIELTATVTARTERSLEVGYYEVDCHGNVVSTRFAQEPYEELTLDIAGAEVGDELAIDYAPGGTITASGTCPDPAAAPTPTPYCNGRYEPCPDEPPDDDGTLGDDTANVGCMSAGGGSMDLALVVLVAGFIAGRRRRTAVFGALALAILAPRAADAAGCYFGPNLLSSPAPRLGCPVVIAQNHYQGGAAPTLRVLRNTDNLDVTGAITTEQREVAMTYYQLDCDGLVVDQTQTQTPFDIFTIELSSKAQVGDMLLVEGVTTPIQPADPNTPCDALVEPMAFCNVMADMCHYDYDDAMGDDAASGCTSTGGGSNALSIVLVLGLVAAARRPRE
ncbi:MAG: hypothetical protein HOV81_30245 [Kofleriaceae bacterium]|nr:hypothetical protein [Kofleriaceae bacterium]